jgi:hypothetical protein
MGSMVMTRLHVATAVVVLLCAAPAQAQSTLQKPDCNSANIASTQEKIAAMKDSPQKSTATSEIAAAKASLSQGNTADCQDHLLKATVQTK